VLDSVDHQPLHGVLVDVNDVIVHAEVDRVRIGHVRVEIPRVALFRPAPGLVRLALDDLHPGVGPGERVGVLQVRDLLRIGVQAQPPLVHQAAFVLAPEVPAQDAHRGLAPVRRPGDHLVVLDHSPAAFSNQPHHWGP
jgi:hypothetical protein